MTTFDIFELIDIFVYSTGLCDFNANCQQALGVTSDVCDLLSQKLSSYCSGDSSCIDNALQNIKSSASTVKAYLSKFSGMFILYACCKIS